MALRAVFLGTPEWAVPSLEALLGSDVEVGAAVTNPDKPAGRKLELHPSPVKQAALDAGLEVRQPASARDPEFANWLVAINPDVAVVVAYGKILPAQLLAIPRLGFVNVHFSLLPLYRGAAPVQRCLMDGCTRTGVSLIVLTEGMDEGPTLATAGTEVDPNEDAGSVGTRLAHLGADLLVPTIDGYARGDIEPRGQDHSQATYAPKISNEETKIDWTQRAEPIRNLIRGLSPVPGAWTTLYGDRLKIYAASAVDANGLDPGLIEIRDGTLVVGTGEGALELTDVQPAGKRRMTGPELVRGLRLPQRKARAGDD